jgi:hypothetical protein
VRQEFVVVNVSVCVCVSAVSSRFTDDPTIYNTAKESVKVCVCMCMCVCVCGCVAVCVCLCTLASLRQVL